MQRTYCSQYHKRVLIPCRRYGSRLCTERTCSDLFRGRRACRQGLQRGNQYRPSIGYTVQGQDSCRKNVLQHLLRSGHLYYKCYRCCSRSASLRDRRGSVGCLCSERRECTEHTAEGRGSSCRQWHCRHPFPQEDSHRSGSPYHSYMRYRYAL
jgi:hypothetical protein